MSHREYIKWAVWPVTEVTNPSTKTAMSPALLRTAVPLLEVFLLGWPRMRPAANSPPATTLPERSTRLSGTSPVKKKATPPFRSRPWPARPPSRNMTSPPSGRWVRATPSRRCSPISRTAARRLSQSLPRTPRSSTPASTFSSTLPSRSPTATVSRWISAWQSCSPTRRTPRPPTPVKPPTTF